MIWLWALVFPGAGMTLAAIFRVPVNTPLLTAGVIALVVGLVLAAGDVLGSDLCEFDEGSE